VQDSLGDRMKNYERRETDRSFLPYAPVYARIDGRSFSKFTKGLDRPFDTRMADAMQSTTAKLVGATNAVIGYTQSDEISLVWETTGPDEEMFFAGKVQKLCSVLAGMASAFFIVECIEQGGLLAEKAMKGAPHFDARVFQLPNRTEAVNALIWREKDAIKNAISMAAHHHFSHKSLQGLNGQQKLERLAEAGVDFEAYPERFRRGVYLRNITREMPMPDEVRQKIPAHKQPPEGAVIKRSAVMPVSMPILVTVMNRNEVIFDEAPAEQVA
jgi:tRNA(His) guanylyltransferase